MKIFFTLIILFFSFNTNSQEISKILASKKVLGSGDMRYLFMKPYSAKLYTENNFSFENEFALELKYNMDFDGVNIAKRSIDEIIIVKNPDVTKQEDWLNQMIQIFPNVKKK